METKKDTTNALKQALERRQTTRLPSNFSFRMMEQIRLEALRRQKQKDRMGLVYLIVTVLALVGGVAAYLIYFTNIRLFDIIVSGIEIPKVSSSMLGFYCYIALLGFILLGLDYWLRRKRAA